MPDRGSTPVTRARVGVLALQGDFALHARALEAAAVEPVRVSLPGHLRGLDALVLPGGESSTMLRLLEATGLRAPIEAFVRREAGARHLRGRDPAVARARPTCRTRRSPRSTSA